MIVKEQKRGYYRGVGEFHWLGQLPRAVAEAIAWRDGTRLFHLE